MKKTEIIQYLKSRDFLKYGGVFVFILIVQYWNTIHYIEDPDSLRFALGVQNFRPGDGIPHFPLYPVFIYLLKIPYLILGKFSYAFSLVNALALFGLFYYCLKWTKNYYLSIIVLLLPIHWIMAGRYMPDLPGVTIVLGLYYSLTKEKRLTCAVLSILLIGVRLSYFPFLIPIGIYLIQKKAWKEIFISILSLVVLLSSLLLFADLKDLLEVALKQTDGHFNDFGGAYTSESHGVLERLQFFWQRILNDGLSFGFSLSLPVGILLYVLFSKSRLKENKYFIIGLLLYAVWILFFQNIVYKFRHVLPLISGVVIVFGFVSSRWSKWIFIPLIILLMYWDVKVIKEHQKPSSIAQLSEFLVNKKLDETVLISSKLLNYSLRYQTKGLHFWDLESIEEFVQSDTIAYDHFILVGDNEFFKNKPLLLDTVFHHNPSINPMWSRLKVSVYGND